ncbi:MAG: DUF3024 domain-containing protein [Ferruginibacter sp.]
MAIDILKTVEIIEALENFVYRKRPPENIRHEVDISYKIDNQSVIIYELRPAMLSPNEMREYNIAKATFLKNKNCWKVFWLRADSKWHSYKPNPTVKDLIEFIQLVEEDKHYCFWG